MSQKSKQKFTFPSCSTGVGPDLRHYVTVCLPHRHLMTECHNNNNTKALSTNHWFQFRFLLGRVISVEQAIADVVASTDKLPANE